MIYTGYYGKLKKYKEFGMESVAISGKVPDFYYGLAYPDFAPRYEMFQRWKNGEITNEGYTVEYKAHLNTLNREEIRKDFEVYNKKGNDCILLCYEKSNEFCHRHVLADWLEETFGWAVEEFDFKFDFKLKV